MDNIEMHCPNCPGIVQASPENFSGVNEEGLHCPNCGCYFTIDQSLRKSHPTNIIEDEEPEYDGDYPVDDYFNKGSYCDI